MIKNTFLTLSITFLAISFLSCTNQRDEQSSEVVETVELPKEGIELRDVRTTPGRVNGVAAIYMNVLNGAAEADSLISLSSPAAGLTEIHESYQSDEGMAGMREAGNVVFPARSVIRLEPGGLHVMLMQLTSELTEGDEIELIIEFANAGEMSVIAPVQAVQ